MIKTELRQKAIPYGLALLLVAVSLILAPRTCMMGDVLGYFLHWARASLGSQPWTIYVTRDDCNYPPLMLYILTAIEALRLGLGASPEGGVSFVLLKLPFILSHACLVVLSYFGLRSIAGERAARMAAVASALCLPVFVNAAVWGQADALLSLMVIGSLLALLHKRPIVAGAILGLALSLKLQAIFAAPALLIYTARRLGAKSLLSGIAAGLVAFALALLPMLLHPQALPRMISAYTDAVGYFTSRTVGAYNVWHILNIAQTALAHTNPLPDLKDNVPFLGPLTAHGLGLLLSGGTLLFLLYNLWRNPAPYALLWTVSLSFFAFFLLSTQMHERYILPSVAVLALAVGFSPTARRLYWPLNAAAGANQIMSLLFCNRYSDGTMHFRTALEHYAFTGFTVIIALVQTALFLWAMAVTARETRLPQDSVAA